MRCRGLIWPDLSSGTTLLPRIFFTIMIRRNKHADEQRDAQAVMTTMDHADIRGLVTDTTSVRRGAAYTLKSGIIAMDAHIGRSRIPLIGPAHRVAPPVLGIGVRFWVVL